MPVQGLTEVKEIAVGNAHAMALRYDGTVWTWGASEFGERGNKEKGCERTARQTEPWFVARDRPTQVPGLSGVKQIAAGGTRDYALLADGEVMAWGDDRTAIWASKRAAAEEELCYGETHAITPIQCSTIPRPVKVKGLGELLGRRTDRRRRRNRLRDRAGGKEVAGLGRRAAKASSATAKTKTAPRRCERCLRTALAGRRNRRRLTARAGAAGQRRSVRLGRRRARPARLRNRAPKPSEQLRAPEPAAWSPNAVRSLSHVVARRGRWEGDQLRDRGRRKRHQGDLLVRRQRRLLRTARPRQRQPFTSTLDADPDRTRRSPRSGRSPRAAPRRSRCWKAAPRGHRRLSLSVLRRSAHARPGRCPRNRTSCATARSARANSAKRQEGNCKGDCSLQLTGAESPALRSDPQEPRRQRRPGKDPRIIGTPRAPEQAGRPTLSPPTISGSPGDRNGQTAPRPDAHRLARRLDEQPHPVPVYQWLRCEGNGEAGTTEELGNGMRTDHTARPRTVKPTKSSRRTSRTRSSRTVEAQQRVRLQRRGVRPRN